MNRRKFLVRSVVAVGAAGLGTVGYTLGIEPHWLEIVERDLPIESLPDALIGKRLVQLSDLHIGPQVDDEYMVDTFRRVRGLEPDIVVLTGDLMSYRDYLSESQFAQLRAVLQEFPHGTLGTVGILGNHDYGRRWSERPVANRIQGEAERAGIQILRNRSEIIAGLEVVGVDDLWAGVANPSLALKARSSDAAIVLVHNPDAADQLPWDGYRGWMLAGHTHGGQCKAPFLPPPLLPVDNKRYVSGEVMVDPQRSLYISRGVGHLIQARFNVRPEATVFTLRRGPIHPAVPPMTIRSG